MIVFSNLTSFRRPALAWEKIKNGVLGKKYELSVVFAGDGVLKKLNTIYRRKNKTTNTLSFPLSKRDGEVFINLKQAKKEAKTLKISFNKHVAFLFIHDLLHLKGFKHGVKMENEEQRLMNRFKIWKNGER